MAEPNNGPNAQLIRDLGNKTVEDIQAVMDRNLGLLGPFESLGRIRIAQLAVVNTTACMTAAVMATGMDREQAIQFVRGFVVSFLDENGSQQAEARRS